MKKLASGSIMLLLILLISSYHSDAQEMFADKSDNISRSEIQDTFNKVRYTNDVDGRILRSFQQSFGDKPGVTWSKTAENLFVASYKENSKTNCVYFTNSGAIAYTLSHYGEGQLSKDIRHIVRSNFYDYEIVNVSEVHKNDAALFFITVQDKASVKLIRLSEGNWQIIKDLARK